MANMNDTPAGDSQGSDVVVSRFAEACRRPFSNGTEGDAWISKWCNYCTRDHDIHGETGGPGCDLMSECFFDIGWPEGWLPEPDDGQFFLPSRLVCLAFEPCQKDACTGDPGAEDRAERVAEVKAYWEANR